jgi:hypothetical protein
MSGSDNLSYQTQLYCNCISVTMAIDTAYVINEDPYRPIFVHKVCHDDIKNILDWKFISAVTLKC